MSWVEPFPSLFVFWTCSFCSRMHRGSLREWAFMNQGTGLVFRGVSLPWTGSTVLVRPWWEWVRVWLSYLPQITIFPTPVFLGSNFPPFPKVSQVQDFSEVAYSIIKRLYVICTLLIKPECFSHILASLYYVVGAAHISIPIPPSRSDTLIHLLAVLMPTAQSWALFPLSWADDSPRRYPLPGHPIFNDCWCGGTAASVEDNWEGPFHWQSLSEFLQTYNIHHLLCGPCGFIRTVSLLHKWRMEA